MDEFNLKVFIDYFLSTYYVIILLISYGLYLFVDVVKNPLKNNWSSPLQGNARGVIAGLGLFILGMFSIYWHLSGKDYPWLHTDIKNPIWDKFTALTIFALSLARLIYLFFFERFKEKEKFKFLIVFICCISLMITSVWYYLIMIGND